MAQVALGSISHGTLRTQDLLRSFSSELERLTDRQFFSLCEEARGIAELLETTDEDHIAAGEVLYELQEHLNDLAPEGYHFGSHEDDGSDFGFWKVAE